MGLSRLAPQSAAARAPVDASAAATLRRPAHHSDRPTRRITETTKPGAAMTVMTVSSGSKCTPRHQASRFSLPRRTSKAGGCWLTRSNTVGRGAGSPGLKATRPGKSTSVVAGLRLPFTAARPPRGPTHWHDGTYGVQLPFKRDTSLSAKTTPADQPPTSTVLRLEFAGANG